jgi:rubrerythrin
MNEDDEQLLPCHEKIAFPTQEQARAAAAIDAYRHGSQLKVYICRYCGFWHLSSH